MKDKLLAVVACVGLGFVQAACGGGSSGAAAAPTALPTPVAVGPVDPALVGTWVGPMDGTFGPAEMTLVLNADGTARSIGTRPQYCQALGNWGVSGGEFTALGTACDGTKVNLVAPASGTTLKGRWFALPNGSNGQFTVTRQ